MLSNSAPTPTKRPRGRPRGSKSKVKPVTTWRDSLLLNPGEVLRQLERATTGTLHQRDVEQYDVLDAPGLTVGTVLYTETTALRPPFRTRYSLVQKDIAGAAIVDRRW